MKSSRSTVRKAGKRGLHGGLKTGASFPADVMATRRRAVAEAMLANLDPAERAAVQRYREALAAGMSDAEARQAAAWPTSEEPTGE